MSDELIPVRKMCAAFDVTPRALRFYEDEGLLSPMRKGTARWYSAADRARLDLVLRGRKYGLSIQEIRALMRHYDPETGGFTQLDAVRAKAKQQLDLLTRSERDMTAAIDDLGCDLDTATRWLNRKAAQAH
ncbi:MAG: MerR family transcriptional regulator [Rhodobacteraceae bacterium]|nr:MerR family transcriptional regulator [Paracoccaceae bacterium]